MVSHFYAYPTDGKYIATHTKYMQITPKDHPNHSLKKPESNESEFC